MNMFQKMVIVTVIFAVGITEGKRLVPSSAPAAITVPAPVQNVPAPAQGRQPAQQAPRQPVINSPEKDMSDIHAYIMTRNPQDVIDSRTNAFKPSFTNDIKNKIDQTDISAEQAWFLALVAVYKFAPFNPQATEGENAEILSKLLNEIQSITS